MNKDMSGFGGEFLVTVKLENEDVARKFHSQSEMHTWLAEILQRDGSVTYEVYKMLFSGGRI